MAIPTFSESSYPIRILAMLYNQEETGSGKSKMAAFLTSNIN